MVRSYDPSIAQRTKLPSQMAVTTAFGVIFIWTLRHVTLPCTSLLILLFTIPVDLLHSFIRNVTRRIGKRFHA